jgi:hypothetical protein
VPKWIRGLAVAALLVAVVVTLSRWPRPHQRPPTPAPPRDLARVEIRRPEGAVRLEKTGETWFVASPVRAPAGEGLVTAVASALNELTLEAVLSERPESHALFEVNEASGTLLRVWDVGAGVPTEWWVGRTTPDMTRAYLRKPGDNRVYLARGLGRDFLHGDPNRWREGRLLPLPAPARARVLRLERGATRFSLERSSAGWTVNGRPAHPIKAEGFENRLRYLAAEDFIDNADAATARRLGLDRPSAVLTVVFEDGATHVIRFGRTEKDPTPRTIARRDDEPTLYWIAGTPEALSVTVDLFKP